MLAILPAGAWLGPNVLCNGPLPVAQPAPYGTLGSGIFETMSWTAGTGAASVGDQFFSGVASPFGGSFFEPFGACGLPCGLGAGGLAQAGIGCNQGVEQSATGTFTRSTAFGLAPLAGVAFGIPVPGPAGLYYC